MTELTFNEQLLILAMIKVIEDLPIGTEILEDHVDGIIDWGDIDDIISNIKDKLQDKK